MAATDKVDISKPKINGEAEASAGASHAESVQADSANTSNVENTQETLVSTADVEMKEKVSNKRKRKASGSDGEDDEEFRGFNEGKLDDSIAEYSRALERMESEVSAAKETFTPVRSFTAAASATATPTSATIRVKRGLRKLSATDVSRPSSGLSMRSDEAVSSEHKKQVDVQKIQPKADPFSLVFKAASGGGSSPANHRHRRPTTEMSSPLLRVPMERGWKRELVFRAALDQHSRRNADIYYYTPQGKKLRSTREIAENLSGTGLSLDNFSFFKEPLGLDDPEKEIIRDAKVMRKDSPMSASPAHAPVEGKRAHKPKVPRGATPEKSPPAKIRVKSLGSRLSNNNTPNTTPKQPKKAAATPTADNNNTSTWKKPTVAHGSGVAGPVAPSGPAVASAGPAVAPTGPAAAQPGPSIAAVQSSPSAVVQTQQPPPAPSPPSPPTPKGEGKGRSSVVPCSILCSGARGSVPTLACQLCLCLFHPHCANFTADQNADSFLCSNCRNAPLPESPPTPVKVAMTAQGSEQSAPRSLPTPPEKRVTLRMKVCGSAAGGRRVWAVSAAGGPQALANINGRRYIVVPHTAVYNTQH